MLDGEADGVPPLPNRGDRERWIETLDREFDAFVDRIDAGEETLLDPYAAEAPEEFFAVASEAFFVAPHELAGARPDAVSAAGQLFPPGPCGLAGSAGQGAWQVKLAATLASPEPV